MKQFLAVFCFLLTMITFAQQDQTKALYAAKMDTVKLAKLKQSGIYPLIKSSPFCGVFPVEGVSEKPDLHAKYKLLFEISTGTDDPNRVQNENRGFSEIGRIINLHIAAGIPKENLEVVIVARGKAIYSLYGAEGFKTRFRIENPNFAIVEELSKAGARLIACGQTMKVLDMDSKLLFPAVKVALSAQVAESGYLEKGFVKFIIKED